MGRLILKASQREEKLSQGFWIWIVIVLSGVLIGFFITTASMQPGPDPLSIEVEQAQGVSEDQFSVYTEEITSTQNLVYLPLLRKDRMGLWVNILDRQSVADFYYQHYLSYESVGVGWTGDQATCNPGTTDLAFREAVIHRVNYYRAMAGVPADITHSENSDVLAQAAALVMSVNGELSHTPDASWTCYSQTAYDGASSSNLSLGNYGWFAITSQFKDRGDKNYGVGHRRWILYPQTQIMGTGDIPRTTAYSSSNALRVFDDHMWETRPPTRDPYVAWPPPGYVPYQVVYPRWSFSYDEADFSAASITMLLDGTSLPVFLEAVKVGSGENTLVWIPNGMTSYDTWPNPGADKTYTVVVKNVLINAVPYDFSYQVIIFDPAR